MWYEYIKNIRHPEVYPRKRHLKLFKDFAFLAVFGFLAVRTTDTETVQSLLGWIIALLAVAISWTFLDWLTTWVLSLGKYREKIQTGRWQFWLAVNIVQLCGTLLVYLIWRFAGGLKFPWTDCSALLVGLCIIYGILLLWDFLKQCQLLESAHFPLTSSDLNRTDSVS
jgi:hypothetical protein